MPDLAITEERVRVPEELAAKMRKQGYHFVGRHSATKICGYTKSSMLGGHACYKNTFYGIRSWRCIQATSAIGCNLACSFCWRIIPEEEGYRWNEMNAGEWDEPVAIVDGLVEEHRRIVSGYKGNKKVNMDRWKESDEPAHVALSLTGEPLFYPKMNELLSEFHRRKISTFLVTNGTMLNALKKLTVMPTQLYVSVQAPNKELYDRITRPKSLNASWDGFNRFLDVFSSMNTRRVFRLTLIKGLNLIGEDGYAELIRRGKPHYVELKGFVYVGGARNPKRNLSYDQMPVKDEILAFAERVAALSGYILTEYDKNSKVALLCSDRDAAENRILKFEK